jgi:uncharacterized protein (DUF305 family)
MWTRVGGGPRLLSLLLLSLLTACAPPAVPPPVPSPAVPTSVPSPPVPSPGAAEAVAFGTDMAWAQLTVALNVRALATFSLVPERAADARLVTLAGELAAGHAAENAQLNTLLRQIGAPAENPHTSHDMPGMATADELASMVAARGEQFDRLFVESLRKHLAQCENLARSMLQAGKLADALALAATIESARRQALARLASSG